MTATSRDYSIRTRTSLIYDDRDGDVVTSLSQPLIKVCDSVKPKVIFFVIPEAGENVPTINLSVESYVRMADIPEPLRLQVRESLDLAKKSGHGEGR